MKTMCNSMLSVKVCNAKGATRAEKSTGCVTTTIDGKITIAAEAKTFEKGVSVTRPQTLINITAGDQFWSGNAEELIAKVFAKLTIKLRGLEVQRLVDDDPDLSYLDQYETATEESEEYKWYTKDQERKAGYGITWGMEGVKAYAALEIPIAGMTANFKLEEITSGGIWGVESDSSKDHFVSLGKEELDELKGYLEILNVDLSSWDMLYKDAIEAL